MGQTLSEPVTAKETSSCSNLFVKVGSSSMQGWRINMEDAHTHLLSVPDDKESLFFAVYDGHGGAKVAQYAGNHLHKRIVQSEKYVQGHIEEAIRDGFLLLDEDMTKDDEIKDELAGTTAVTCLIKEDKLYCGNVGDSRCVASVNGLASPLSFDHKPANESEAKRIVAAGGWVEFNRVNGNLALSRALGDFIFKRNEEKNSHEQIVTALPDVIIQDLTKNHEFLILACDGIWDVLSNQEAIDFCRDRIASGLEPEIICEELLTRCLAPDCQMGGLGCDNMTAILVVFLHGDTYEAANARCAQPRPPSPEADYSTAMSGAEQTPAQGADSNTGDFSTPPSTPIAKNSSQTRPADPQSGVTPPLEIPIGVQPPAAKATADDVISDGEYASAAAAEDDSPPQQVPDLHRMSGAPGADPAAHADDDSPPMNFQADTPVSGDRTTSSIAPSKSSASDSSSDSRSQAATTTEKASSIPDNAGDAAQLHAGSKRRNN